MSDKANKTTHIRVDRTFARYLARRAIREKCSVVELSRRIVLLIRKKSEEAWQ
jgi:hypothetical protein